jgi:NitT/TauT family transport system substrate-binding protein
MHKAIASLISALLLAASAAPALAKDPLKLGYCDWPAWTILEIANQKGWFAEAGVDVQLVWFDYSASLDAYSAGKIDGDCLIQSDAMVLGASGTKSKFVCITDYSSGNDMIIGRKGVRSLADLKGQKVALEVGLDEHYLLVHGLEAKGLDPIDVPVVNTSTDNLLQVLASGEVGAVGAWYPVSGQILKSVPGATKLYSTANAPGLIWDVIAASPTSFATRRDDWAKVAQVYFRCVAYLQDPATSKDAIAIMSARVGVSPEEYVKNLAGTHFLSLPDAKAALVKGNGLMSLYDSMIAADKFNLENNVYKTSQNPDDCIVRSMFDRLK